MNPDDRTLRLLEGLSRRLQSDRRYMAYTLAAYKAQEGLDDEDLTKYFHTYLEMLVRLALCKRPDADATDFAEQIRTLADFSLIDESLLAHVIRQVDSLESLAMSPMAAQIDTESAAALNPLAGTLAAARDRDEAPTPPTNTDGTEDQEES